MSDELDLVEEAKRIFEADDNQAAEVGPPRLGPGPDAFINLKGKLYLPARQRINWLRMEHPDWTIDTDIVEHDSTAGRAILRANIFDEQGRLISTGLKSETRRNFGDYLEKAETGAIARACAVAGYGTESALDLDEGYEADHVADAPAEQPTAPNVTAQVADGVGRGGRSATATATQVREVAKLAKQLGLTREGILLLVAGLGLDVALPSLGGDVDADSTTIKEFLMGMDADTIGRLISTMREALG